MTLNVLNGMAMFEFFSENCNLDGEIAPFNEAMCDGFPEKIIFDSEFIEERCACHMCEREDYESIVLDPLKDFLQGNYDELVLWFDEDMFCQVNLITILAYVDMTKTVDAVVVNMVDSDYNLGYSVEVPVKGFYDLYLDVLVLGNFPREELPPVMQKGVLNYIDYKKEDGEIMQFARENIHLDEEVLLEAMAEQFIDYGLGDKQLYAVIDRAQNKY